MDGCVVSLDDRLARVGDLMSMIPSDVVLVHNFVWPNEQPPLMSLHSPIICNKSLAGLMNWWMSPFFHESKQCDNFSCLSATTLMTRGAPSSIDSASFLPKITAQKVDLFIFKKLVLKHREPTPKELRNEGVVVEDASLSGLTSDKNN